MDFIAGCLGGCAGVIVGHPLDTVKVHLQVQSSKYNSTYSCLRGIVIKDGFKGLYRGMSSPLIGVSGINAIIFGVYGITQKYISQDNSIFSHFVAGGVAGLSQSILTGPVELAKSRAQLLGNVSATQCIKKIYNLEGVRGVFRGLNITIAREIPAFGSYFASYEFLTRFTEDGEISTPTMILAGGTAGVISWIISYPIDVIKSRMQIDGLNGVNEYKNSMDCLKQTVEKGGYKSLFRGLTPAVIRAFPVNAACFTVVTWTMRLLNNDLTIEQDNSLWDGSILYSTVVYNMQTQEPFLVA